jgi:hypothetical protein
MPDVVWAFAIFAPAVMLMIAFGWLLCRAAARGDRQSPPIPDEYVTNHYRRMRLDRDARLPRDDH